MYTTNNGNNANGSTLQNIPSPSEGQPQVKEFDEDAELPRPQEGDWQDDQHEAGGRW